MGYCGVCNCRFRWRVWLPSTSAQKVVGYHVFVVSLLGAVAAKIPLFGMADFPIAALIGGLIQLAVTAFLIWYAKWVQSKDWIN